MPHSLLQALLQASNGFSIKILWKMSTELSHLLPKRGLCRGRLKCQYYSLKKQLFLTWSTSPLKKDEYLTLKSLPRPWKFPSMIDIPYPSVTFFKNPFLTLQISNKSKESTFISRFKGKNFNHGWHISKSRACVWIPWEKWIWAAKVYMIDWIVCVLPARLEHRNPLMRLKFPKNLNLSQPSSEMRIIDCLKNFLWKKSCFDYSVL